MKNYKRSRWQIIKIENKKNVKMMIMTMDGKMMKDDFVDDDDHLFDDEDFGKRLLTQPERPSSHLP